MIKRTAVAIKMLGTIVWHLAMAGMAYVAMTAFTFWLCRPEHGNKNFAEIPSIIFLIALFGLLILAVAETIHWIMAGDHAGAFEDFFWALFKSVGTVLLLAAGMTIVSLIIVKSGAYGSASCGEAYPLLMTAALAAAGLGVRYAHEELVKTRALSLIAWDTVLAEQPASAAEEIERGRRETDERADRPSFRWNPGNDNDDADAEHRTIIDELTGVLARVDRKDREQVVSGARAVVGVAAAYCTIHFDPDVDTLIVAEFERHIARVRIKNAAQKS